MRGSCLVAEIFPHLGSSLARALQPELVFQTHAYTEDLSTIVAREQLPQEH